MMSRLLLVLLALPLPALAVETSANVTLMQWLASCFLVIALILVLAWLLKKSRLVPSVMQSQLKVVSMLPLGSREKLLVVKVGEQQLLLGMTPNQISLLYQLDKPLPENGSPHAFAGQLSKWMAGAGRGQSVAGEPASNELQRERSDEK